MSVNTWCNGVSETDLFFNEDDASHENNHFLNFKFLTNYLCDYSTTYWSYTKNKNKARVLPYS